jgi:hypothetical protein
LNNEIKRRSAVVGLFPIQPALIRLIRLIRLVGAVLAEKDAEWSLADRRFGT